MEDMLPVPVSVSDFEQALTPDFRQDVNPVISKMGCNAGTCHGAKDGKNGFKLSLRGYDPIYDVRAFTDDLAGRRINFVSPDDSLMLLKATSAVPHQGGSAPKSKSPFIKSCENGSLRAALWTWKAPRWHRHKWCHNL